MTASDAGRAAPATVSHDVVICTRNRPDDLAKALESVAIQSLLPDEVLVVDSSDDDRAGGVASNFARQFPSLRVRVLRTTPGLPAQRNLGAQQSSAEVLHFLDDDVVLEPDYLEELMPHFQNGGVLGVGGLVTNQSPPRPRLWWRLALLDSKRQGVILGSGQNIMVWKAERPLQVDWLSGCSMSYRRHVVISHRFDEGLPGYALMEDADFGYRVSRTGTLLVEPRARLAHNVSPVDRWDFPRRYRTAVRRRGWFVAKNMPKRNIVLFYYSVGAGVAVQIAVAVVKRQRFGLRVAQWWFQGAVEFGRGLR